MARVDPLRFKVGRVFRELRNHRLAAGCDLGDNYGGVLLTFNGLYGFLQETQQRRDLAREIHP